MTDKPGQSGIARYAIPLAGLSLILVVAPLFFSTSMRDVFTLSKSLPISVGVAATWIWLAFKGKASLRKAMTPAVLAVAASIMVSSYFSVDIPMSVFGPHQQQFYAILPLLLCALVYYASANSSGIPPTAMVTMALLGGGLVSVLALSQVGGEGFMPWSIQGGRAGSTFGSPIFLGTYLSMLLPLAWTRRPDSGWPRITFRADLILISIGIIATRSVGSMVAAISGILLIEYVRSNNKRAIRIALLAVPVVAAIIYLRKHSVDGNILQSNSGRIEIWKIAIEAWKSHPVLGWGPDTFSLAFRQFMTQRYIDASNGNDKFIQLGAHNDILQVLSTMGAVGMAAYLFMVSGAIKLIRAAMRTEPEAIGIAGSLMAMFVSAKFNPVPLSVMAVAACLLGSLDRFEAKDRSGSIIPAGMAPAIASVALVFIFGTMCNAERHQRMGENLTQTGHPVEAAEEFNKAAQINPFDMWYTQRQADYLWSLIPIYGPEARKGIAVASLSISRRGIAYHPNDATSHEVRSISLQVASDISGLDFMDDSYREIKIAEMLAPRFSTYSARRKEIELAIRRRQSRLDGHGNPMEI